MTNRNPTVPALALALTTLLGGCAATPSAPAPVATISHVVFVRLADPADTPRALADSDATLRSIPSVASYSAGVHIDTGRDSVLSDYDVGIVLGFDSAEDLAAYVAHPAHVAFVERWKDRVTSLRVYDIHDR
jgi:hypothetical protein